MIVQPTLRFDEGDAGVILEIWYMLQCVLVLFECFIVFRVSCKELGNMFIIIIILLCSQQSLSDTWMVMVGTTWMGWDGMRDRE